MAEFTLILLLVFTQVSPPQEYTARPGDFITVTVFERQTLSGTVTVDGNGRITLPMPIGSVPVVGLTAAEISDLLTDRIKEYVLNPTVFVTISPAEGFTVHVLGEVQLPDFIKVLDNTTVQEAITRAGGFTPIADIRHIQLIRTEEDNGYETHTEIAVNLEQFVENGVRSANPVLKPGDVLIVPRMAKSERMKYVNVMGAVARPGTFQVEGQLPLIEALAQAGGPSAIAMLDDVSILSISEGNPAWKHVNFESFLTGEDETANPDVLPGDTVFVSSKPEEDRPFSVNVLGQVLKPGVYPVTGDSRLLDAIYQAGGFADEAAIDKVTIFRYHSESSVEIQVDLKGFFTSGNDESNPLLQKGDTIFIPISEGAKKIASVHTAFLPTMRVGIIGEVAKPGTYQVSADASVLDILYMAGGHTSNADLKRVTLIRETLQEDEQQRHQTMDMEKVLTGGEFQLLPQLKSGDTIFVPKTKPGRELWRSFVRLTADVSTIALAYLIISGKRY
jgi:protein involved in polysaccharide export with SLBB domain